MTLYMNILIFLMSRATHLQLAGGQNLFQATTWQSVNGLHPNMDFDFKPTELYLTNEDIHVNRLTSIT